MKKMTHGDLKKLIKLKYCEEMTHEQEEILDSHLAECRECSVLDASLSKSFGLLSEGRELTLSDARWDDYDARLNEKMKDVWKEKKSAFAFIFEGWRAPVLAAGGVMAALALVFLFQFSGIRKTQELLTQTVFHKTVTVDRLTSQPSKNRDEVLVLAYLDVAIALNDSQKGESDQSVMTNSVVAEVLRAYALKENML